MKKINWPTVLGVGAVLLVIFMVWGAFGGLSGKMGPGQMFYSTLCATAVMAVLVLWVARNLGKKKKPETQICPNCAITVPAGWTVCPHCQTPLK